MGASSNIYELGFLAAPNLWQGAIALSQASVCVSVPCFWSLAVLLSLKLSLEKAF